jgi:hypothetical protein
MPVTLSLQENGRILYWQLTDPWSVSELTSLYPQVEQYFNNANQPIHSLLDFEAAHRLPSNALSARQTPTWNHPQSGQMAIAGSTAFIRGMLELMFRLVQFNRIKFFEHEPDARRYLISQLENSTTLPSTQEPFNQESL